MCGILGVRRSWLARRTGQGGALVQAALDQLRWRGPDDCQLMEAGDWWLGCTRLSISGPHCRQPVRSRRSGLLGVMNGAITSARAEWGRQFAAPLRHRLPNDAWLPLRWTEAAAPEVAVKSSGHFAAAVLDPVADRLLLFRDHEGEKPLFVLLQGERPVAFASTPAALAQLGVSLELPVAEQARWFRFGFCSGPVVREPGLRLRSDLRGVLDASTRLSVLATEPDHVAEGGTDLRARVVAAAARCADAPVGVALALSGGLDSSCLALALAEAGRRVPAYQFRAEGTAGEERNLAMLAAQAAGLPFRPVDGGPEVLDALWDLTRAWGMALGDPSLLAVHALAKAVAADGHRVLLAGEGADELWFGYRRQRALRWLPDRGLRSLRRMAPAWSTSYGARLLRAASAREPYEELMSVTSPGFRTAVLAPEFAAGTLEPGEGAPLERARVLDRQYLRWDLLPKLDVAAMAAGVEGRCPYLDREVRALAAPAVNGSLGKRDLRRAFADLPAAVLRGSKRGFGLPLDRWLRTGHALLDLVLEQRSLERPHLQRDGVRAAVDRHRSGKADLGHGLYLLAAMEVHLRCREEVPCASAAS